jgi:hypothetical protein
MSDEQPKANGQWSVISGQWSANKDKSTSMGPSKNDGRRARLKWQCYAKGMAPPEKQKPSILGFGQASNDPNAWRASKAARLKDSGLSLTDLSTEKQPADQMSGSAAENRAAAAWWPSQIAAKRLSSLSTERSRKGFRMPRAMRPALTIVFFVCAAYVFLKLWFMPTAGGLHPALAISAGILALLAVLLIAGAIMRRKRKGSDDKSTLRL